MDLHFTTARANGEERDAVDRLLGNGDGDLTGAQARGRRHMLLPVLHAISERVGWISGGALNYACERLGVPPAEAYGVATFYDLFSTTPRPPTVLHMCDDIACRCAGAEALCDALEDAHGVPGAFPDESATWLRSPCLGLCDRAPAALLAASGDPPAYRRIAPATSDALASSIGPASRRNGAYAEAPPHVGGTHVKLLRRVGAVDPESLDAYRASGGYEALFRAIELGPQRVIDEVVASNLLGRGGAAFPAGRKMQAVAGAKETTRYLVCNADESEPGTFKDRVLMEHDPFAIVEAMTIAAYATRCERGFIYVRGEYPQAARRLQIAIDAAREALLLGDDVAGSGAHFDVQIRRGAGAYICGEETALFNSIEGKRGEPRSKPPFPVESGLFGKPTLANNVETLANLPSIVLEGGAAYAAIGTPASTGTRIFCLSGCVAKPGVYEVAHGATLGAVIDMAGGVRDGGTLRSVLLGGAAGSFVGPDARSMPLTFEDARAAGTTLGSGVVMLFDDRIDMKPIVQRIARFFRHESCGQCVPCRVGTVRQEEILERICEGRQSSGDAVLLGDVGRVMRDASICGLGQTAAGAIASAVQLGLLEARA